jgi:hypothetical protein
MWSSHGEKALVECNTYESYTMEKVLKIPDYKVVLPKGKFNGLRAHYNIRMDPDLGIGRAALRLVPCGCASCMELMVRPWVPLVDRMKQPQCGRALRVQMTGKSAVLFLSQTMMRRERKSH